MCKLINVIRMPGVSSVPTFCIYIQVCGVPRITRYTLIKYKDNWHLDNDRYGLSTLEKSITAGMVINHHKMRLRFLGV